MDGIVNLAELEVISRNNHRLTLYTVCSTEDLGSKIALLDAFGIITRQDLDTMIPVAFRVRVEALNVTFLASLPDSNAPLDCWTTSG